MKETLRLLASFETVAPAAEAAVSRAQAQLNMRLPADYVEFLYWSNGGEGIIGETYLMLWQVEDLAKLNIAYEVEEYAAGLLLFGSNGGGEAFAFDTQKLHWEVVRVPFVGMDKTEAIPVATTFADFFRILAK
ncbi:MAG: SMI1/KNR4 family protein [Burkholderiales bacterium]